TTNLLTKTLFYRDRQKMFVKAARARLCNLRLSFIIGPYTLLSNGGQPVGNCPSGWFFCRIKYVRNVSVLHTRRASRSPRRMRPDLQVESVRGNVDTRLQARRGAVCRHRIGRRWTEPLGIVEPD